MSVFYKFKAWREPATIAVDSTGISVWDLKKEIISANNLAAQAKEFDLHLYNSQSQEEFRNDHTIVPRSTTVIAQRLPAKKPHRGTAQNYVVETAAAPPTPAVQQPQQRAEYKGRVMSMRFDQPSASSSVPGLQDSSSSALANGAQDEAARIEAMFEQSDQQWEQTQNEMAMRKRVPFSGKPGAGPRGPGQKGQQMSDKPPPPGYICYRCATPGHWIQDCPTNNDPNFENRPKAKKTTGIPKSFLQTVEEPAEGQTGLMQTADGGFVIARPDAASWAEHRSAVPKNLSAADVQALQPEDPDLQCSIDSRLLRDAVKVPCCSTSFCQECITKYLQAHSFVCPECESKVKSLAQLKPDEDRRERVSAYIEDLVQASRENKAREEESEAKDKPDERDEPSEGKEESKYKGRSGSPEGDRPHREGSNEAGEQNGQAQDVAAQQMMGLQMQLQQVMMMLSNPMLPPPARMQLTMQAQQLQMMFMMQQQAVQQQQQQQQSGPGTPSGRERLRGSSVDPRMNSKGGSPVDDSHRVKRRADSELEGGDSKRTRDDR